MCRLPLTVGGGVSIEKTSSRVLLRSKRNVPSASQRLAHFCSSPSRLGLSGADGMVCSRYLCGLRDQDSVLAVALGLQQRVVRVLEHLVERGAVAQVGDPERRGEHRRAALVDGERQLLAQALERGDGRVARAVGEHEEELLAAVAGGDVTGAQRRLQRRGEQAQGAVAGVVAVGVVEQLEVVEVAQRDREGALLALQAVDAI